MMLVYVDQQSFSHVIDDFYGVFWTIFIVSSGRFYSVLWMIFMVFSANFYVGSAEQVRLV